MMTIKHFYQPTGNTCGPTCLYMALGYVLKQNDGLPFEVEIKYNIKDIAEMCGTDWVVGTPPDRMEKGMVKLNLKYIEYIGSPRPYELLKQIIDDGNVPILRTITQGIPHWIIVQGYDNNDYKILDPSMGQIIYKEKDLDAIWKLRQYQFFEVIVPLSTVSSGIFSHAEGIQTTASGTLKKSEDGN